MDRRFADPVRPSGWSGGVGLANLEIDATGRLFTNDLWADLRIFTASGALERQWLNIADHTLVTGKAGSMRISGDGLRLIGNGRLMGIAP
ncbi:MAG TPA: hypothetical protein VGP22_11610 [Albitalea sp.]|nr:hypothetical protein [Albitalea sp.]